MDTDRLKVIGTMLVAAGALAFIVADYHWRGNAEKISDSPVTSVQQQQERFSFRKQADAEKELRQIDQLVADRKEEVRRLTVLLAKVKSEIETEQYKLDQLRMVLAHPEPANSGVSAEFSPAEPLGTIISETELPKVAKGSFYLSRPGLRHAKKLANAVVKTAVKDIRIFVRADNTGDDSFNLERARVLKNHLENLTGNQTHFSIVKVKTQNSLVNSFGTVWMAMAGT